MECLKEQNLKDCTCTYPGCSRKGLCCECVKYHRLKGQISGCFFPKEGEKTFNRNLSNFLHFVDKK